MSSNPRVYLAGPMVFYPDAATVFAAMKATCRVHGLVGDAPTDGDPVPEHLAPVEKAALIRARNIEKLRACDLVLACLSPFRGPGADAGTAWEMGFAEALGKPVVPWTEDPDEYAVRATVVITPDDQKIDDAGWYVEDFGLADNLMMAAGPYPVMGSFEEAVEVAAAALAHAR